MLTRSQVQPKFVTLFRDTIGLTDAELDYMLEHFSSKPLKRKEYYLESGDVCRNVAYVNHGCFRTFYPDDKGKEHTLYFAMEDWWIGDIESFHSEKPTTLCVQALEDSELLLMPKSDFKKLSVELPKYHEWYEIKVRTAYMASIKRYADFKSGSAEERYKNLMKLQPQVLQRVASKYIADYLEIEPESLSRLKKKLFSKV